MKFVRAFVSFGSAAMIAISLIPPFAHASPPVALPASPPLSVAGAMFNGSGTEMPDVQRLRLPAW